ncbi:MAG: tetratricopeptide repeat protein [Geitlerinemataceae cyanobacterium]
MNSSLEAIVMGVRNILSDTEIKDYRIFPSQLYQPMKTFLLLLLVLLTINPAAFAQDEEEDAFPPNPLELTEPDPLIPDPKKPLTPAEQQALATALDAIDAQATQEFQAGNPVAAYDLWNRELRLRRFLGPLAEVEALGRVGKTAWNEGNFIQVQLVSARLREIETENFPPIEDESQVVNLPLLLELGRAYDAVGVPERAVTIYARVLEESRFAGDRSQEEAVLNELGKMGINALNYPAAAAAYEQLLELAQQRQDTVAETTYLEQLVYVYDQIRQLKITLNDKIELVERSTQVRQRLFQLTESQLQTPQTQLQLVDLRLALAADYADISDLYRVLAQQQQEQEQTQAAAGTLALAEQNDRLAEQTYRETYVFAWSIQQFSRASAALSELGTLYEMRDRPNEALEVYNTQLDVHQISRDRYGVMMTYDRIGSIYQTTGAYSRAIQAYENALTIAQQLGDREAYFTIQLQRLRQQVDR